MVQQEKVCIYTYLHGFPRWCSGKESACQCRKCKRWGFDPWVGKIPWRRKWQPTSVFLPEECHRLKSLASHSPGGRRVGHDWIHTHICILCIHSNIYNSMPPIASREEVEATKNHVLETFYPISPTISLQECHIYDVNDDTGFREGYPYPCPHGLTCFKT